MELDRARVLEWKVETFDRPVVERDVCCLARLRRGDGEAVVLARDEHATRAALEHRMVRTAMAERELERLVPGREGQQLMSEADTEDR